MFLSLTLISCDGNSETNKTTDESKSTEEKANNTKVDEKKDTNETEKKDTNETEKKDTNVTEKKTDTKVEESKKQMYLDKLESIKVGLKDLDELYAGNNLEMTGAASKEYERWDAALNEIYGVLKTQLSKTEMSNLEKEEIQWIKDKQAKAEDSAADFNGGTGASFAFTSSLASTTKDRCYELVNKYMK
jgi:uncharacterized protein YecT (DUF1311 family)